MALYFVGYRKYNRKTCFRILNDFSDSGKYTAETKDLEHSVIKRALLSGMVIEGLSINSDTGDIETTMCSKDRYPVVIEINNGNRRCETEIDGKTHIIILFKYNYKKFNSNSMDIFRIALMNGNIVNVSENKLIDTIKNNSKIELTNGKLVSRNGVEFISAINGSYKEVDVKDTSNNEVSHDDTNKSSEKDESSENKHRSTKVSLSDRIINGSSDNSLSNGVRVVSGSRDVRELTGIFLKDDEEVELTLSQIFYYCTSRIEDNYPLTASLLKTIDFLEDTSGRVNTAAVDYKNLYYNAEFIMDLELGEIEFILMHEALHIMHRHMYRGIGKESKIWNIACDYYINSVIYSEMQAKKSNSKVTLVIPGGALFSQGVDVNKDTPELLYNKLLEQFNQSKQSGGYNSKSGSNGSSNGSSSRDTGSDDSSNGSSSRDNSKSGKDDNSNGSSSRDSSGSQNNKDKNQRGKQSNGKITVTTFDGNERELNINDTDLVISVSDTGKTSTQINNESCAVLDRAQEYCKMYCKNLGSYESKIMEQIGNLYKVKINWSKLLRNMLVKSCDTTNSYISPDRRYRAMGKVVPGKYDNGEVMLRNIALFIDTSGSISISEMTDFLSVAKSLIDKYKSHGYVCFWNTEVYMTKEFESVSDIIDSKIKYGGTEPSCIYKYLLKEGDKGRFRITDSDIIVILTDGIFDLPNIENDKQVRKLALSLRSSTLWVLKENFLDNANKLKKYGVVTSLK